MSSTAGRDMFVNSVYQYAADGLNSAPLSDYYWANNGSVNGFRARPVVGGHLALVSGASYEWKGSINRYLI